MLYSTKSMIEFMLLRELTVKEFIKILQRNIDSTTRILAVSLPVYSALQSVDSAPATTKSFAKKFAYRAAGNCMKVTSIQSFVA